MVCCPRYWDLRLTNSVLISAVHIVLKLKLFEFRWRKHCEMFIVQYVDHFSLVISCYRRL